jgi:conjugal transfer/entry exclusion protein
MAERNLTKAERRQAAGNNPTKAERKQAKNRRKQPGVSGDGIESRLARLEQAVATQSELSEQLMGKLDEVLHEARKSARHSKTAVAQADHHDHPEPDEGV